MLLGHGRQPFELRRVNTLPAGFEGVLIIIARVRGVIAARTASRSASIPLASPVPASRPAPAPRHARAACRVVAVERLEQQHLVARVEQRRGCGVEGARRPGGDQNLAVRVDRDPVRARKLRRDRLPQTRNAIQPRVDVEPVANGAVAPSSYDRRRFRIADPLRQVDAVHRVARDRHGPNLRLDRARRQPAHLQPVLVRRSVMLSLYSAACDIVLGSGPRPGASPRPRCPSSSCA